MHPNNLFISARQNHTDNNHKFQPLFKITQIPVGIPIVVIGWAKHGTCDYPLPTQGQTKIPRHHGHTTNRIRGGSDRQVHCGKDRFTGMTATFPQRKYARFFPVDSGVPSPELLGDRRPGSSVRFGSGIFVLAPKQPRVPLQQEHVGDGRVVLLLHHDFRADVEPHQRTAVCAQKPTRAGRLHSRIVAGTVRFGDLHYHDFEYPF